MLLRIMLLIVVIALLGGCETMKKKNIAWEMDECSKSYNRMIRWHELDKAGAVFPPEELQEEFTRKADCSKGCYGYRLQDQEDGVFPGKRGGNGYSGYRLLP